MILSTLLTKSALLRLVTRQHDRLTSLGIDLGGVPFALCVRNSAPSAATVQALAELRASVVLVPNGAPRLLAEAARHAGAETVLDHDEESGAPFVVCDAATGARRRRSWLRSAALDAGKEGACVVATSGSGQQGSKLVAYRWRACELQAEETARRTLNDAAAAVGPGDAGDGTVRFVAASNIGHAYNLNGLLSALRATCVREVGVPPTANELAAILAGSTEAGSTVLFATPKMYADLLRAPAVASGTVGQALRGHRMHAYSAGCPLPPEVRRSVAEALGFVVQQNYGSSETGNVALQNIHRSSSPPDPWMDNSGLVGVPWGEVRLLPPRGGALLPEGSKGEVSVSVPWASAGYVCEGELVPHTDPYIRMGDAGAFVADRNNAGNEKERSGEELQLMGRLRPPLEIRKSGMRVLLQQFEVEEAILRANPSTVHAAAALQGPSGELWCAVAMSNISAPLHPLQGAIQPDRVLRLDELPTSPAGKVLYSELVPAFQRGVSNIPV